MVKKSICESFKMELNKNKFSNRGTLPLMSKEEKKLPLIVLVHLFLMKGWKVTESFSLSATLKGNDGRKLCWHKLFHLKLSLQCWKFKKKNNDSTKRSLQFIACESNFMRAKRKSFDNRKKEENAPLMYVATRQSF